MSIFKRLLALLAPSHVEPETIEGKLDQVISKAVWNGFEAEYDDLCLWITDLETKASYCADYATYPGSLDGADAWINDRITARPQGALPVVDEVRTRKVGARQQRPED